MERARLPSSVPTLQVVTQDLYGSVGAAYFISRIGKLNGDKGGLRLFPPGEAHAAAKEPYLGDHVTEVGAGV